MSQRKRRVVLAPTEIDLTSMIDVIFLLIAFLIMVTEVSKAEIVEVFLPFASNAVPILDEPDNRVILNIDRNGEVYMKAQYFGLPNDPIHREAITLALQNDAEVAGFDNNKTGAPSELSVFLRTDAHTKYKYVQCVMMILVEPRIRVIKVHYVAKNPLEEV